MFLHKGERRIPCTYIVKHEGSSDPVRRCGGYRPLLGRIEDSIVGDDRRLITEGDYSFRFDVVGEYHSWHVIFIPGLEELPGLRGVRPGMRTFQTGWFQCNIVPALARFLAGSVRNPRFCKDLTWLTYKMEITDEDVVGTCDFFLA